MVLQSVATQALFDWDVFSEFEVFGAHCEAFKLEVGASQLFCFAGVFADELQNPHISIFPDRGYEDFGMLLFHLFDEVFFGQAVDESGTGPHDYRLTGHFLGGAERFQSYL